MSNLITKARLASSNSEWIRSTHIGPKYGLERINNFMADTLFFTLLGNVMWGFYYSTQYTSAELQGQINDLQSLRQMSFASEIHKMKFYILTTYLKFRLYTEEKLVYYAAPAQEKLLPDVTTLYGPFVGPQIRTLVLDLIGTLVHAEWSRDKGWRYYKRPGIEDFLKAVNQAGWEVVVYTPSSRMLGDPLIEKLDPQKNLIVARLYREQTQYVSKGIFEGGSYVCDLSKLNRDLKRVLFISSDMQSYEFQPENTLKIKKWQGESGDTTLLDLLPMLEMIVKTNVADTRQIVKSYDGKELIVEFKKRIKVLQKNKTLEGNKMPPRARINESSR